MDRTKDWPRPPHNFTLYSEIYMIKQGVGWVYSADEAVSYAQGEIAYCDRMSAQYPSANLADHRKMATSFLEIVETKPLSLERLSCLHKCLLAGESQQGTGWLQLLRYVDEYIKHLPAVKMLELSGHLADTIRTNGR